MKQEFTFNGITYREIEHSAYGDYGGYGSVGVANTRVILEDAKTAAWDDMQISHREICDFTERKSDEDAIDYFSRWASIAPSAIDLIDCINRNEAPGVLRAYALYGYNCLWLRSDIAAEYIERLDSYPCLDDEAVSEVDLEWESEAWESWLRADLLRGIETDIELDDTLLFDIYRQAMEEMDEYPTSENDGVHVDVDRIKSAFERLLAAEIAETVTDGGK
jgi:hypothetical protein